MDRFIGCEQEEFECPVSALLPILQLAPELQGRDKEVQPETCKLENPNHKVRGYIYNMEDYIANACNKYCELCGISAKQLRKVATPFVRRSS